MTEFARDLGMKVLLALIVPLLQLVWTRLRRRGREHRIRELRDNIKALNDFLAAATSLGDTPEAEHARSTAIEERTQLLAELTRATQQAAPPAQTGAPGFAQLPKLRQAFLLYAPKRATAWFGQALFFLSLLAAVFGTIGVLAEWDEEGPATLILVVSIYGLFSLAARTLAVYADRPAAQGIPERTPLKRWFLLFRPLGVAAWVLHIIFHLILFTVVVGTIATIATWSSDPEAGTALLGFAVLSVLALLVRAVAIAIDSRHTASRSEEESRPSRVKPTLCFCFSLFVLLAATVGLAMDENEDLTFDAFMRSLRGEAAWILLLALLLTFVSLGWAWSIPKQSFTPVRPPVGKIRRVFLLYRPSRPIGWVIRALFACSVASFAGIVWLSMSNRNLESIDAETAVGLSLLLLIGLLAAICAQRWAVMSESTANSEARAAVVSLEPKTL